MVIFKNVFYALFMKFFWQKKIIKIWTLEKLENMMKNECFCLGKKRSHLLNLHLYQFGKAQNMPVVAGRLVHL